MKEKQSNLAKLENLPEEIINLFRHKKLVS